MPIQEKGMIIQTREFGYDENHRNSLRVWRSGKPRWNRNIRKVKHPGPEDLVLLMPPGRGL